MSKISMILLALLVASAVVGSCGDTARSDSFYTRGIDSSNTIWVIGKYGVEIFSVNGKRRLHRIPSDEICRGLDDQSETIATCNFQAAVSDGLRHVWVLNTHGGSFLEVFNIRAGTHVASIPTCEEPIDLEYAPFREEIYVHCWRRTADERGRVLVYHAHQVGIEHRQIDLNTPADALGESSLILDGAMPNKALVTLINAPFLEFVDLNNKIVYDRLLYSNVYGFGKASFSAENKHVYVRPSVCCRCGRNADTEKDCDDSAADVDILSGPYKDQTVKGYCGKKCYGTAADDGGVMEVDSADQSVVARHEPALGNGAEPYTTPDGQLTFLIGYDGGQKVTVLRSKGKALPSEVAGVIDLNFSDEMGFRGVSDVAFINDDRHDLVAFSSTVSNDVILVDINEYRNPTISNQQLPMKSIRLQPDDFVDISARKRSTRNIVWAPGSNYLWVDSNKLNEVHVIILDDTGDVSKAKLHETISNVVARKLLYVNNYEEHGGDETVDNDFVLPPSAEEAECESCDEGAEQGAVKEMIDLAVEDAVAAEVAEELPDAVTKAVTEELQEKVNDSVNDAAGYIVTDTVNAAFAERDAELQHLIDKAVEDAFSQVVYPKLDEYEKNNKQAPEVPPQFDGKVTPTVPSRSAQNSASTGSDDGTSDKSHTLSVAATVLSVIAILVGLINFYTMSMPANRQVFTRRGEAVSLTNYEVGKSMDAIDLQ